LSNNHPKNGKKNWQYLSIQYVYNFALKVSQYFTLLVMSVNNNNFKKFFSFTEKSTLIFLSALKNQNLRIFRKILEKTITQLKSSLSRSYAFIGSKKGKKLAAGILRQHL
jgi:hypothetical protein